MSKAAVNSPIENPDPIVKPSDTFDKLICVTLELNSVRNEDREIVDASASITLHPYSSETGEDLPVRSQRLVVPSIEARILANPESKWIAAKTAIDEAVAEEYALQQGGD